MIFILISWHILSSISLFIISALIICIISKMYLFCSLFFVSHSIFSIIISECMSLLILMSVLISFFFMFLDISSILISCITTSKLISCRHAFNDISLIQKSIFFNVFLLLFILIQNISSFNYLFIIFMFLRINNVLLMSISFTHFTKLTTRFICTRCWLQIFCKLCLLKELNNLINIDKAVTAFYSCIELTHSQKARQ